MSVRIGRWLLASLALPLVVACASKPQGPAVKPLVRTIAVVPAAEPREFTLTNESGTANLAGGLFSLAVLVESKARSKVFQEAMAPRPLALGAGLTAPVAEALRDAGYTVEVLDTVQRPADDPDDINPAKLKTDADAVVLLRVDAIGIVSPKGTFDYLPRLNVRATAWARAAKDEVFEDTFHYGVDAQAKDPTTILAEPRFTFASYDAVMARLDDVAGAYQSASGALGRLVGKHLVDALATSTRRAP